MKGAIFAGDRSVELIDLPEPERLRHGEVLLKMMPSGQSAAAILRRFRAAAGPGELAQSPFPRRRA